MEEIIDLDILRPKIKKVKLAGKILDISYIPCGVTFEIDGIIREMGTLDVSKLDRDTKETKRGFDLTLKLCSTYASIQYPEMTEEWFRKNCSAEQLNVLVTSIRNALTESYKGVEQYGKN